MQTPPSDQANGTASLAKLNTTDTKTFLTSITKHMLVSETDVNGIITDVNPLFRAVSGYSKKDLLGKTHKIINSGIEPAEPWSKIWKGLAAGKSWHGEICNRAKNGYLYWVDGLLLPILDTAGQIVSYMSIQRDVTEKKQKYVELVKHMQAVDLVQCMAEFDLDGKLITANKNFLQLFGYELDELVGEHHRILRDAENINETEYTAFWDELKSAGQVTGTYKRRSKSGKVVWVHAVYSPMFDSQGSLDRIIKFATDVTQQIESKKALENEQARLATLISSNNIGTWELDHPTGIRRYNRYWASMLGFEEDEVKGLTSDQLKSMVHPDDLHKYLMVEGDPIGLINGLTDNVQEIFRMKHKNGHWRSIQARAAVVARPSNGEIHIYGTHIDVTHLEEARQAAEVASRAKDSFLATMSHELRTPMNAILGFGQILQKDDKSSPRQKQCTEQIMKAGQHLLALINDVLDLAKISSGSLVLNNESVSLNKVFKECRDYIGPLAQKRNITLNGAEQDEHTIYADPLRVKQILLNLLSNAVKYNRENGKISIEVLAPNADLLQIRVTDTGEGIPPERLPEIFKPFNRLNAENSNIEGTGIGLSITRELVLKMNGDIGLESTSGVGTTVWVNLPTRDTTIATQTDQSAGDPSAVQIDSQASGQASLEPSKKAKILCVDDNAANLSLLEMLLEDDYDLTCALTPYQGLTLANANPPDLILLDINMPGMSGFDVLRVLQLTPHLAKIPVIAVSASALESDIAKGKAAGFFDYITKPIDQLSFTNNIAQLIGGWTQGKNS
jgi:PAS domain S-box-containing protein